jgi:hypothetical protein
MENFISDAMVIEGALFSFLLALFMTWLGLSGLFRILPGTLHVSLASANSVAGQTPKTARQVREGKAA